MNRTAQCICICDRSPAMRRDLTAGDESGGRTARHRERGERGQEEDHPLPADGKYAPVSFAYAPALTDLPAPLRSRRIASTATMRCPIQRMTGTAIELPRALIAWPIGGEPAAILDQGVIVGESLQALALAWGQSTHGHPLLRDCCRAVFDAAWSFCADASGHVGRRGCTRSAIAAMQE